jgi:hypothetical protein
MLDDGPVLLSIDADQPLAIGSTLHQFMADIVSQVYRPARQLSPVEFPDDIEGIGGPVIGADVFKVFGPEMNIAFVPGAAVAARMAPG